MRWAGGRRRAEAGSGSSFDQVVAVTWREKEGRGAAWPENILMFFWQHVIFGGLRNKNH
jgi:hypothetical protein